MATRHVLVEAGGAYAQATGRAVDVLAIGGVDAARRVQEGEAFDFVVLAADVIARLAAAGRVRDPRDLARSEIAVAVARGAQPPDIESEGALREAVLAARGVGYSSGPSGAHLAQLFDRWGIASAIASRLVQAPPGTPVATLIARGDVALGFQQRSELLGMPGIDIVGPLPASVRCTTIFTGAVCTAAPQPAAASAFLAYVGSAAVDDTLRRHGMQPAR